ncbi:MAG: nuclear transport factor 2 family protein [Actinobacteria bacterium]|nr:nuclear transport factor 2 family protein [Actinomycetota bacterium]
MAKPLGRPAFLGDDSPVHLNEELIARFYSAFGSGDHGSMEASYTDDATFSDPVFPELSATEVRAMWRMFCTSGNDIKVHFDNVQADDRSGSANWQAVYRFPKSGREVHNEISASFLFRDGKIVRHRDTFDFYAWTRMALGPTGTLLGWTPIVRGQVRKQAAAQLRRFQAEEHK